MMRSLWLALVGGFFGAFLGATPALALDITDANNPISCEDGKEVFFPRGDSWAFLPNKSTVTDDDCRGVNEATLDPEADTDPIKNKRYMPGHCLWVYFSPTGPAMSCPSGTDCVELSRKIVFASMRKWAGYMSGNATLGDAGKKWYCPSPTGGAASSGTQKSVLNYTFGVTSAQPSFNFFRGPNLTTELGKVSTDPNRPGITDRADKQECYAACKAGQTCTDPLPGSSNPTLYNCDKNGGLLDETTYRFHFSDVKNVVAWVKSDWKNEKVDDAVLAITETLFWRDNGVAVTSDMLFNSDSKQWRIDAFEAPTDANYNPVGCSVSDANCFDLETVATHESGHFIGFGHTDCADAVMYKSATHDEHRPQLTVSETAGACSLYRPNAGSRYPTATRENDGCTTDTDCGGGLKCVISNLSALKGNANWPASVTPLERYVHRGICAKACSNDADCDPDFGRVCQTFDNSSSYCLPGSPNRQTSSQVNNFCTACTSAADCGGGSAVCVDVSLESLGELPPDNAPTRMCSVSCQIRSARGCPSGYTCQDFGGTTACRPLDVKACFDAAAKKQLPLNASCDETTTCATGLLCWAMGSGAACIQGCDATHPCDTGFGCLLAQGDDGQALDYGGCFKESMKEGDSCFAPTSGTCGLQCTTKNGVKTCVEDPTLLCGFEPQEAAEKSRCYKLCKTAAPSDCAAGQKCQGGVGPYGDKDGYCTPISKGRCYAQIGEVCTVDADCDSNRCGDFNSFKACTASCDLDTKTGCPESTLCTNAGSTDGKGLCKPKLTPAKSSCPAASNPGCVCGGTSLLNPFEGTLLAAGVLVWVARRRRRSAR